LFNTNFSSISAIGIYLKTTHKSLWQRWYWRLWIFRPIVISNLQLLPYLMLQLNWN